MKLEVITFRLTIDIKTVHKALSKESTVVLTKSVFIAPAVRVACML